MPLSFLPNIYGSEKAVNLPRQIGGTWFSSPLSTISRTRSFINLEHHVPSARILRNKAGMNKTQNRVPGDSMIVWPWMIIYYTKNMQTTTVHKIPVVRGRSGCHHLHLLLPARIPKVLSQLYFFWCLLWRGVVRRANPQVSLKNPEAYANPHSYSCFFPNIWQISYMLQVCVCVFFLGHWSAWAFEIVRIFPYVSYC